MSSLLAALDRRIERIFFLLAQGTLGRRRER
jgi:hypothetical protein